MNIDSSRSSLTPNILRSYCLTALGIQHHINVALICVTKPSQSLPLSEFTPFKHRNLLLCTYSRVKYMSAGLT